MTQEKPQLTGWSPVYSLPEAQPTAAPTPQKKAAPKQVAIEGLDLIVLGVGGVLIAGITWLAAGSYYGSQAREQLQKERDAATHYAEQLQGITEKQGMQIQNALDALGCLPTEGPQ